MFLDGGEVRSDGTEGVGALWGAEVAGDLLLDLGHADGLLGEVVAERNVGVDCEAENIVGMIAQATQEIERETLSGSAALAAGRRRWVGDFARFDDGLVLATDRAEALGRQRLAVGGRGFLLRRDEQFDHLLGPRLAADLMNEGQFAQVMGIAQRKRARQIAIGNPSIMDESTGELSEDAEGGKGLLAAACMEAHPGQRIGDCCMQPVEFTSNPQARLIGASDRRVRHRLADTSGGGRQDDVGPRIMPKIVAPEIG